MALFTLYRLCSTATRAAVAAGVGSWLRRGVRYVFQPGAGGAVGVVEAAAAAEEEEEEEEEGLGRVEGAWAAMAPAARVVNSL